MKKGSKRVERPGLSSEEVDEIKSKHLSKKEKTKRKSLKKI